MTTPTKLMYVSGLHARDRMQQALGSEWRVLAYGENRTGFRADTMVLCPLTDAADFRGNFIEYVEIEKHALMPGGLLVHLP